MVTITEMQISPTTNSVGKVSTSDKPMELENQVTIVKSSSNTLDLDVNLPTTMSTCMPENNNENTTAAILSNSVQSSSDSNITNLNKVQVSESNQIEHGRSPNKRTYDQVNDETNKYLEELKDWLCVSFFDFLKFFKNFLCSLSLT